MTTTTLRVDELEAVISRILGLEASYEVRLCRRSGPFRRTLREVQNDKVVCWRDVPFRRLKTVGTLNRAIERRYGFECHLLDVTKKPVSSKFRLAALRGQRDASGSLWRRIVGRFFGK